MTFEQPSVRVYIEQLDGTLKPASIARWLVNAAIDTAPKPEHRLERNENANGNKQQPRIRGLSKKPRKRSRTAAL